MKSVGHTLDEIAKMSPSTRRVWIEIGLKQTAGLFDNVTLHAEGVD